MQRSSKSGETSLARYDIIVKTFWGLPSCFLVWIENFSSQHQTSTTFSELVREDGSTLLLPRSPARFLTSTPKPRAEGSSPSAPAKKPAETLGFCRFSFCMCCMVMWCTLVRTLGFLPLVLFVPNRPHPLQHPKRTRFRLFRAFSRCAFLFSVVFGLQNFPAVFMYPAL